MRLESNTGSEDHVVVVDETGRPIRAHEKYDAHRLGLRHLAISVFLFNDRRELLIQKRAAEKYHCAGLWANTCCGHPRFGETPESAASRRLYEELGLHAEILRFRQFSYQLPMPNGLVENELVSLFWGWSNETVSPNPREVAAIEWCGLEDVEARIKNAPESFAPWFKLYVERIGVDLLGEVAAICP